MPVCVTAGALCAGEAVPGPEPKQPKGLGQCLLPWAYPLVLLFSDETSHSRMYWGRNKNLCLLLRGPTLILIIFIYISILITTFPKKFYESILFPSYYILILQFPNFLKIIIIIILFLKKRKYLLEIFSTEQM